jgi:hypothetical protein
VAEAIARAPTAREIFIVNLSGRGDKDIDIYRENLPELDERPRVTRIGRLLKRLRRNSAAA